MFAESIPTNAYPQERQDADTWYYEAGELGDGTSGLWFVRTTLFCANVS